MWIPSKLSGGFFSLRVLWLIYLSAISYQGLSKVPIRSWFLFSPGALSEFWTNLKMAKFSRHDSEVGNIVKSSGYANKIGNFLFKSITREKNWFTDEKCGSNKLFQIIDITVPGLTRTHGEGIYRYTWGTAPRRHFAFSLSRNLLTNQRPDFYHYFKFLKPLEVIFWTKFTKRPVINQFFIGPSKFWGVSV